MKRAKKKKSMNFSNPRWETPEDIKLEQIMGRLERVSSILEPSKSTPKRFQVKPGSWAYNYWDIVRVQLKRIQARLLN
tara:strand:- start:543 stop:776 length:234 start_codon:yes stop_codon:yes gene_type:complete